MIKKNKILHSATLNEMFQSILNFKQIYTNITLVHQDHVVNISSYFIFNTKEFLNWDCNFSVSCKPNLPKLKIYPH